MNKLQKIIIMALWTVSLFWLPLVGLSFGATETFYVCEGGDGTLPETATCSTAWDDTDLQTAGNWESGVDADDGKVGANDEVQFMDEGGDMRYRIWIHGSGSSGKPITFKNYPGDTPVINTSEVLSSWSTEDEAVLDEATTASQALMLNLETRTYVGQGDWTSDDDYTISAIGTSFHSITGTGPGTVVAEIYNVDGSDLGTQPTGDCTSDSETISGGGPVKFTGMSCSLSNASDYQIVFSRSDSSYDGSNAAFLQYTSSSSYDGQYQQWNSSGVNQGKYTSNDTSIILYETIGNLYYAAYSIGGEGPNAVFWDDSLLTEESVKGNLGTGEWYDDETNDRVYVYDDPDGVNVEAPAWAMCIHTQNESYLFFDGLTLEKSNGSNLWIDTASGAFNDITIQNCTIENSPGAGIAAGIGGFGDTGHGVSSGLYILNNTITKCALTADDPFAVRIAGNSPTDYIEDVVVSGNIVTDNPGGALKSDWFANDITWEYNYIESDATAFSCDGCQNIIWRYNVINDTDPDDGWAFSLFRWEGDPGPPYGYALTDNMIIGNVMYGNENGISLQDDHDGTIVKNNIYHGDFVSNTPIQIEGGETLTDVEIDYNLYYTGANTPVFNESGVDTYNFTEWQAEGFDANSVVADPLFTDATNDDFMIPGNSPAVNAGETLGTSYDDGLHKDSGWPGNVYTTDQDLSGTGWEIGAYVYSGTSCSSGSGTAASAGSGTTTSR